MSAFHYLWLQISEDTFDSGNDRQVVNIADAASRTDRKVDHTADAASNADRKIDIYCTDSK